MSERSNDTPDGGPDDLSSTTERIADESEATVPVAGTEPVEAAAVPDIEVEAVPEVAAAPEIPPAPEVEVAPEVVSDETAADQGEESAEDEAESAESGLESESELELEETSVESYAEDVEPAAAAPIRPMSPGERRAARSGLAHGQLPIDPALRIKDRVSSALVLVTVGVFVVILMNALVLGQGGLLTPVPTIVLPTPIVTPAPTATPAPTGTPAPTASPAAS